MILSPQAFSLTHGSTMLHSLVYNKNMHEPYKPIKFYPSQIYSENPKQLNQSLNAFQMTFRETDQNGGAQAKIKQVFKDELNTTGGTIKSLLMEQSICKIK